MEENKEQRIEEKVADLASLSLKSTFDYTKLIMPVAVLLAALIIAGTLLYTKRAPANPSALGQAPIPAQRVDIGVEQGATLGNPDAKVVVIEFSDFECPFCKRFWSETFPQLKKNYIDTGKIFFAYRHFPLDIHPNAEVAARASICAQEQDKFWEYHDAIFENQASLSIAALKQWASGISGMNVSKFSSCVDSGKYADVVANDLSEALSAGVNGTPSFFINGQLLVGALPYSAFQTALDEALSK